VFVAKRRETKSPFKRPPARLPGQSLGERIESVLYDKVLMWVFLPVVIGLWAVFEWIGWAFSIPRQPVAYTVAAVGMAVLAVFKLRPILAELRSLRQGLDGEKIVGQALEQLRADGYTVVHDLVEDGYNIDHVLLGPTGVYAIETKSISKPTDHEGRITYNGERLLIDGYSPDRDPLKQVTAAADRVREIIEQRTGHRVNVRPVLVYPGWFVQRECPSPHVWVVNEKYLPGWLDHEPGRLDPSHVRLYATALESLVRT
jgi:hypothetical protein